MTRIIIESILVFFCAIIGGGCVMFGLSASAPLAKIALGAVGLVNTAAAIALAAEVRGWIERSRARQERSMGERILDIIAKAEENTEKILQDARQRAEEERTVRTLLRDLEG